MDVSGQTYAELVSEGLKMRKITRQEIVCEIWSSRSSQFQEFILTKKWISCPYNFDNFVRDMLRNDLVTDKRTLKTKWEMLECSGIVRTNERGNSEISFEAFSDIMPATLRIRLYDLLREEERSEKARLAGATVRP